jgi:hypothetical protein
MSIMRIAKDEGCLACQAISSRLQVSPQLLHPPLNGQIKCGLRGKARRTSPSKPTICSGSHQSQRDFGVARHDREHQGAQTVLGREVQSRSVLDQKLHQRPVSIVGRQHESRLPVVVSGIDILTGLQEPTAVSTSPCVAAHSQVGPVLDV